MDQLDAMRLFVRVAELESFTRCAEQLGIPKATLSAAIRRLVVVSGRGATLAGSATVVADAAAGSAIRVQAAGAWLAARLPAEHGPMVRVAVMFDFSTLLPCPASSL